MGTVKRQKSEGEVVLPDCSSATEWERMAQDALSELIISQIVLTYPKYHHKPRENVTGASPP